MTTDVCTPLARRMRAGLWIGATVVTAAALVAGCSGGSLTDPGASVASATPGADVIAQPPATTQAPGAGNDDIGRKFDLGTIVKVEDEGGAPVLIFDRWSAIGVADSKLASEGVEIGPHSDMRFENQNRSISFRIPVANGAIFAYSHCVSVDQPGQQRSSTLQEFTTLKAAERVMLLTLDAQGRVLKAENDPAC